MQQPHGCGAARAKSGVRRRNTARTYHLCTTAIFAHSRFINFTVGDTAEISPIAASLKVGFRRNTTAERSECTSRHAEVGSVLE
jgi:hypothetical protein